MTSSEKDNNIFTLEGNFKGKLCFNYLPCINYAIYNNHIPTCFECAITNFNTFDWKDVTIKIEGADIHAQEVHISQVAAGESVAVNELNITPKTERLIELTEAIYSPFKLSISCEGLNEGWHVDQKAAGSENEGTKLPDVKGDNGTEREIVFEKEFSIYLMAYDQWCGSTIMPELLSTFVIPNNPLLTRVINNAAKHLEKFSGSASFDEYQTQNPNRVRM